MKKSELIAMQTALEKYADSIQEIEDAGENEQLYNELWNSLDEAGGTILEILGET
jgi:hypothetical protein